MTLFLPLSVRIGKKIYTNYRDFLVLSLYYALSLFLFPFLLWYVSCLSDEEGCGDAHSMQLWVLEQLLAVVRNPHLPRTDSWLLSIARFLLLHAYFEATTQLELVSSRFLTMKSMQINYGNVHAVGKVQSSSRQGTPGEIGS